MKESDLIRIGESIECRRTSWPEGKGVGVQCMGLTIGQEYEILNRDVTIFGDGIGYRENCVEVVNDDGEEEFYPIEVFTECSPVKKKKTKRVKIKVT